MQKTITVSAEVTIYENLSELPSREQELMLAAGKAMLGAYAPYSNFRVGAAVLLESGEIIIGNNQENAAYPSGLCAERVALFAARANHPGQKILAVAIQAASESIAVSQPVSPCGGCRQVMAEYELNQNSDIPVLFCGESGPIYRMDSVSSLLPLVFKGEFLEKS